MSSLWDVPQYLIMAFSLALDAPAGKASRVSFSPQAAPFSTPAKSPDSATVPGETMWLRAIKAASPHSDVLKTYASRIFVTTAGRYYVPAAAERAEILSLRANPDVTTRILAAATQTLRERLKNRTQEEPTRGALLIAHTWGEEAGARYLRALLQQPHVRAASVVPSLASVLHNERELTIAQVDARLARATRASEFEVASGTGAASLKGTMTKPEPKIPDHFASR